MSILEAYSQARHPSRRLDRDGEGVITTVVAGIGFEPVNFRFTLRRVAFTRWGDSGALVYIELAGQRFLFGAGNPHSPRNAHEKVQRNASQI